MANYTDVRDDELESIRNDFYYKYKDQIDRSEYHKDDLQRLKKDTAWLRAFYKHGFSNHDKTVSLIHDVLVWRKDFDANNLLTPGKYPVPEELFTRGAIFPRNEDINCNPMLHFVVKLHKKDQFPHNQICKFIAYFFEKAYKFNVDDPIVLMFDMSDAGYSNLDMDMIKFVVSCLKSYYPGLIDYMIIYQMPFIFNAAWKIIKNWLPPEAIKLIKFVDKKSVKEYVQESQLFVHMGGTDTYKFTYDPKQLMIPLPTITTVNLTVQSPKSVSTNNNSQNGNVVITNVNSQLNAPKREPELATTPKHTRPMLTASNSESLIQLDKKKQTPLTSNLSVDSFALNAIKNDSEQETQLKNGINGTPKHQINGLVSRNVHRQASELTFGNVLTAPLLSINPGDELIFNTSDGKSDIVQYLKLTNTSDAILAYKIKITSPDKFRVKPGTGIIQPSTCVQIMISFLKDFHTMSNNNRDKFLILWTPVDEQVQASEINDFWKQIALKKVNIQEHKVKCVVLRPSEISKNNRNETMENGQSANSSDMFTSNDLSRALSAPTGFMSQKSKTDLVVDSSNAGHIKKLSKLLGDSRLTPATAADDGNITTSESNKDQVIISRKLYDLDSNMNKVLKNQQKIIKQHSVIIFLIYFLILINLIQVLFQSNLFTQVIEPYIDYYLFQRTE